MIPLELSDERRVAMAEVARKAAWSALRGQANAAELVAEVVSEVFARYLSQESAPEDNLLGWTWRVARNEAVRVSKLEKRYVNMVLSEAREFVAVPDAVRREVVVTSDPEMLAVLDEYAVAAGKLLGMLENLALAHRDGELYRLHVLEQRPWGEVAGRSGLGVGAARVRLLRLLTSVRTRLLEFCRSDQFMAEMLAAALRSESVFGKLVSKLVGVVVKEGKFAACNGRVFEKLVNIVTDGEDASL